MIFRALDWLPKAGVLGMNRRNAEYIMKWNPRSAYPLVDDKLLTKQLAEKYQIPTPHLYHVIQSHGDVAGFEKILGDKRDFVVKPVRGSGGSGILLIKERTGETFVKQSGEVISRIDLYYHISSILSGIYSLEGLEDCALIEALVYPDPVFTRVTFQGVPDIRVIVYRGTPVMGMVRLPTRSSDGKANLHRGAIGAGIDISKGKTLTAVHRTEVITDHPDTRNPVSGILVPYWPDILLIAAQTFEMTGLGYLGVDLVIDQDRGPLLLEMNARPGLAIQLANRTGLWERLERVDKAEPDIFAKPELRVAWAVQTFI